MGVHGAACQLTVCVLQPCKHSDEGLEDLLRDKDAEGSLNTALLGVQSAALKPTSSAQINTLVHASVSGSGAAPMNTIAHVSNDGAAQMNAMLGGGFWPQPAQVPPSCHGVIFPPGGNTSNSNTAASEAFPGERFLVPSHMSLGMRHDPNQLNTAPSSEARGPQNLLLSPPLPPFREVNRSRSSDDIDRTPSLPTAAAADGEAAVGSSMRRSVDGRGVFNMTMAATESKPQIVTKVKREKKPPKAKKAKAYTKQAPPQHTPRFARPHTDRSRHPTATYHDMNTIALCENGAMTTREVYSWFVTNFAFFDERVSDPGWKTSVRRSLSAQERFVKIVDKDKSSYAMYNVKVASNGKTLVDMLEDGTSFEDTVQLFPWLRRDVMDLYRARNPTTPVIPAQHAIKIEAQTSPLQ